MILKDLGNMEPFTKAQYLRTLVGGEALHKFDLLSADVESANSSTVGAIILILGAYFFLPIRYQSKSARFATE